MQPIRTLWRRFHLDMLLYAFLLAVLTVYIHVYFTVGVDFIKSTGILTHQIMLKNGFYDPWQYRILNTWLAEGLIRLLRALSIATPEYRSFFILRVLQNTGIFYVGFLYWRQLGIRKALTVLGIMALGWGMMNANFNSYLAYDTYMDMLLYLLAGYVLLRGKPFWILPLSVVAGLNRETGGLIPFLLLAVSVKWNEKWLGLDRKTLILFGLSLLVFALEFFGLRWIFGPHKPLLAHNQQPGIDLLLFNLTNRNAYIWVLATLGIVPIFALVHYRKWSETLKRFFWVVAPVWFLVNFAYGSVEEARLLLVPQVLVFLPAALYAVQEIIRREVVVKEEG